MSVYLSFLPSPPLALCPCFSRIPTVPPPPQEKGVIISDDGPRENGEGTRGDLRGDPALLQDIRGRRPRPPGAHPPVRPRVAGEPREPGGFRHAGHSGEPGRKEQGRTRAVRESGEKGWRSLH